MYVINAAKNPAHIPINNPASSVTNVPTTKNMTMAITAIMHPLESGLTSLDIEGLIYAANIVKPYQSVMIKP